MDQKFIKRIPKCELHLHIEGCLEPELMLRLAKRNGIRIRHETLSEIRKAYHFGSLRTFLDVYYEGASVLRNAEDFYDLAMGYFIKAASQNVRHAEIFFDPQTHVHRGVPFDAVIEGLWEASKEAKRKLDLSSYFILCFLRHLSGEAATETLRHALPHRKKIVGVGLDSYEVGHPPVKFREVFTEARRLGFETFAHAGEEGPASYIRDSLKHLKVRRIDHGIRSLDDRKLTRSLVTRKIPLTVCPLSNVKLGVFRKMEDHNLRKMLQAGLKVTVNSDDPAYFGGYVNENFLAAQKALKLTRDEIVTLVRNSFEASLLPEPRRRKLLREVDRYAAQE
ncbi:MAG: adenosine deaminase [Pseudomonadota bacterium]